MLNDSNQKKKDTTKKKMHTVVCGVQIGFHQMKNHMKSHPNYQSDSEIDFEDMNFEYI